MWQIGGYGIMGGKIGFHERVQQEESKMKKLLIMTCAAVAVLGTNAAETVAH